MGRDVLEEYDSKRVKPSAYWANASRRATWERRLMRWYRIAAFAVWSCDCLANHLKKSIPDKVIYGHVFKPGSQIPVALKPGEDGYEEHQRFSEWREFCSCWGLPTRYDGKWRTMPEYARDTSDSRYKRFKSLQTDLSFDRWWAVAKLVMLTCRVPGAPGTLGEQIADHGDERHPLDMPDELGSAVPPYWINQGKWHEFAINYWIQHTKTQNFWTDTFLPCWNAVFGALTSVAGGAFSTFVAVGTAAFTSGTMALRAAAAIGSGEATFAEVVDVVYRIGECAATVGAAVGADVQIPSDLWGKLKSGGEIVGFGGDLADQLGDAASYVQATLSVVQQGGYSSRSLDALLGGIVSD